MFDVVICATPVLLALEGVFSLLLAFSDLTLQLLTDDLALASLPSPGRITPQNQ